MSKAVQNLCCVVNVNDDKGYCQYSVFKLKGSKLLTNELLLG